MIVKMCIKIFINTYWKFVNYFEMFYYILTGHEWILIKFNIRVQNDISFLEE